MHRKPSDNRVDVDDEEEEPRFKYQSMRGTVPLLLASDAASCIAVEKRMIALGTHGGFIYILDFIGNQVRKFSVHSATVNDLCFDIEGEYIGSCSDDGSVVINSLFTDKIKKFEYHRPMKAIALDPDYKRKSSRRFVAGGLAGRLYFNTKKWMRNSEQVLHSGQGPIHAVKWRTSLIAWANDAGVMVHDTANDQCIAIDRPRGSRCPELLLPHLVWQDDTLLVIGWGTSVQIASIKTNQNKGANGTYGHISMSSMYQVDIVASFQTSYFISGIAPFGDFLIVLAYILGEDGDMEFCSTIPSRQGNAQRPELHVVTWNNDELATDALPVHEHYKAKDCSLAHAPFSGSSYAGGQWAAGDEPLYYVVSPKDVVIAEPRFTVAAVCCDEISKKKLSSFASNEEWCQLDKAVQTQPVSGFGKKLSSILATCLSEYDMEATCFNEGVRSAKRQQLEEKLLQLVQSAHQSMLGHIWLGTLDRFKEAFDKALNGGEVFSVAAHDCSESFMIQFDEGCADAIIQQATWDSSKMREKFQRDIDAHVAAVCGTKLSELAALYEKKLNEALLGPVDALFDGAGKDTWPAIRKLLCVETKSAVSGLSAELSSFDMDEQTKDKMLKSLGDYARGIVKSKEKEEAGRVLLRMKDRYRFPTSFSHDSDSMPRIWSGNKVIRAIAKMARSASLKLLSVMAAIRLDDDTDNIEKTQVDALVDTRNGVATNKSITSADSLASSTWEEVPLSKKLIPPAQFKSLWRQLAREYSVTQAISAQTNRERRVAGRLQKFREERAESRPANGANHGRKNSADRTRKKRKEEKKGRKNLQTNKERRGAERLQKVREEHAKCGATNGADHGRKNSTDSTRKKRKEEKKERKNVQEASQRNNNWLPPPWAILALVVLSGFMTQYLFSLRNPLYLGPIFVAFLLVKALWVQLDICGEFRNGALPGLLSLSTKFLPIASSSTASSAVTSLENGTGYSSPSTHEKVEDAKDLSWLIQHGRHEKALEAVEAGQGQSELFDEVVSNYLDSLIVERKYAEAASLCPKLLRGSASAWKRWVSHFARLCQLPVLVPYMPTENPRLSNTDYEVALVVLATNPSFHKDLLSTVKSWPSVIYSALPVISAIEPQLNTLSMTDALKETLVELYVIDGQSEKAFSLYADLMKPVFIENHNLQDVIREKVVKLMMLACKDAVPLLTHHSDLITPSEVVSQLLAAGNKCDSRYFLHLYLHSLFEANPDAGRDFRDIQVELYADFDPKMLLPFLRNSQHYTLEKAYDICVKRDLLREQAFILGRMGDSRQALAVIINKLGDIEEAKEFVRMQHDDELWEELIKQCFHKPEMVGVLLEHTVGNLDPLYIMNIVPNGLEIPRLRDRLVKVITDYRTEISLRHGCNEILKADCVDLLIKYYKEARRAICLNNKADDAHSESDDTRASQSIEKAPNVRTIEVKSKTRGGGRCCICFDPFSMQSVSIIVFFCCHAYHTTCLSDSTNLISGKKAVGATSRETTSNYDYDDSDVDDDNDDDDDDRRMRCILCTTAAS